VGIIHQNKRKGNFNWVVGGSSLLGSRLMGDSGQKLWKRGIISGEACVSSSKRKRNLKMEGVHGKGEKCSGGWKEITGKGSWGENHC